MTLDTRKQAFSRGAREELANTADFGEVPKPLKTKFLVHEALFKCLVSETRFQALGHFNSLKRYLHTVRADNTRPCSVPTPCGADAFGRNLIRELLSFRQPFESLLREQASNERVDDLLQRKHEQPARRVLDFVRVRERPLDAGSGDDYVVLDPLGGSPWRLAAEFIEHAVE